MRFGSALVLTSTCLLGVAGCSSDTARPQFENSDTGGSDNGSTENGGSNQSTVGKGKGGSSLGQIGVETPTNRGDGTKAVPDDDPSNPNITHPICDLGTCKDFPSDPIMGDGVPDNAAELFGDADNMQSGSLCVVEPHLGSDGKPGTMIPANWVRPRFRVEAPSGIDLFEIRIHSEAEANDLVAYTKQKSWYMPKEIWNGNPDTASERAAGSGLANNGAGKPVTVTIRGINSKSPGKPIGMKGDFEIAPVVATGSMVFWTVNSALVTLDSSKLLGFAVGDEGVAETLTLNDVAWSGQIGEDGAVLRGHYDQAATKPKIADGQVRCIGCHASTPDTDEDAAVVFGDDWPWAKAASMVSGSQRGNVPKWVSSGGRGVMKMPWWGTQNISKAHWSSSERIIITSYGSTFSSGTQRTEAWAKLPNYASEGGEDDKIKWHKLAWINAASKATIDDVIHSPGTGTKPGDSSVQPSGGDYGQALDTRQQQGASAKGTGYGIINTGDSGVSAVMPNMSHDGLKIAYTTTDYSPDGHPDYTATTADIRIVDYNDGSGGKSQPLEGAADSKRLEYYPSYSPDDKFIAFTSAPAVSSKSPDGPYCNRFGEIHVISAEGGSSTKLAANDPPECASDDVAEGIMNSWPKWAPDAFSAHGKTYYFVIFSSARKYGDEFAQQFDLDPNSLSNYKGLRKSSQLYLAAVVVDEEGNITTYPALYVWNQNRLADTGGKAKSTKFSNLTPDWAAFALPDLTIEEVPPDIPR